MALSPGTRLGPYEILSAIGVGGMGEVYRARDTRLDRDVAIKILPEAFAADAERVARFQREAKVLASLNHPNIAIIHGLEHADGAHALVMEFVEGEDLAQRIVRGAIPIDDALPIAKQIAEALEAAHEQGIIHRDLKPANIKVRPDGTVKVLDFGLAKAMEPVGAAANVSQSPTITTPAMTQAGMILGTAGVTLSCSTGRNAMIRYLVAFAVLCFATAASAQTPDTVFIEKLTWEEVRDGIAAGKTTIIVPTGGTEQNGPHMALGKHNVRIAANAENIARRLGNALVAPVVAYTPEGGIDPPTGHMRFPGTISIPDPVFRQVLEYIARSVKQHGFRDVVFIGDSGPNQAGQIAVAATLNAEWAGANTRVHAIPGYYRSDPEGDAAIMMARGIKREQIGNHADPRDTSQMMAVDPTMVRNSRIVAADGKNGIQGDPRGSTAEIGRALIDKNMARTVDLIRQSIAAR